MDITLIPTKSSVDVSTNTIWVVGRSSAATRLIHQLSSTTQSVSFRKVDNVFLVAEVLKTEPRERQKAVFVETAGFTTSDFIALRSLKRANPDVPIAVCFSANRLDLVSYAMAFSFTAYLTVNDLPADCQYLVRHLLNGPHANPLYSVVFRGWLRNYGILFEHDQLPLRPTEWD